MYLAQLSSKLARVTCTQQKSNISKQNNENYGEKNIKKRQQFVVKNKFNKTFH